MEAEMRLVKIALAVIFMCITSFAQAVRTDMLVSSDWLADHLHDSDLVVLHVGGDRASYDAGHIPGARFLPLSSIAVAANGTENELPPAAELQKLFSGLGVGDRTHLVLYGDMQGLFAARAWFTLDYLGHGDNAALLDGGIEKWKKEKRELSTASEATAAAAEFTARIQPQTVVAMRVVRDISHEILTAKPPNFGLVDARPREEYEGTKPGKDITRPGHIPGAKSVYWMQNVESKENPVLRSAAALRQLYAENGLTPSRTAVTYCRTGVQASFSYFTLRYLGYDVMLYDGSYLEWSRATDNPVDAEPAK